MCPDAVVGRRAAAVAIGGASRTSDEAWGEPAPRPRSGGTMHRSAPCAGPSLPRGAQGYRYCPRSVGSRTRRDPPPGARACPAGTSQARNLTYLTAKCFSSVRACVRLPIAMLLPIVGSVRPGRCRYRVRSRSRPSGTARGLPASSTRVAAVRVVQSPSSRLFTAMHCASDGADAIEAMPGRRRRRYERGGVTENTSPTGRPDRKQTRLSASRRHHARDGRPFRTRASCRAGGKLLSTSGR
ncbi:hypothetical protein RR21198_5945 [Rhodococcus rhodochrous ATCC 21198]|nr:hypothetical protein RR21198_5945 [Rhodococcus rhodochrous ATCC 21198]